MAGKTLPEIEAELRTPKQKEAPVGPPPPPPVHEVHITQEDEALLSGGEHVHRTGTDVMSWVEKESGIATYEMANQEIIDKILDAENNYHEWTLMHRCNLCSDLLEQALGEF